jgi:hypothetical protein
MGVIIGISGVFLFVIGMGTSSNQTLDPAKIAA